MKHISTLAALFVAFVVALCGVQSAQSQSMSGVWSNNGSQVPTQCSYTGYNDGCLGVTIYGSFYAAPTHGDFNVSQEFTGGTTSFYQYITSQIGSGQTWTSAHPWNWNAVGVDYNAGLDSTLTLLDPTNSANLPTGCSYLPGGNPGSGTQSGLIGNPVVFCDHQNNLTLNGYEWGIRASKGFPSGVGSAGGCVQIDIGFNETGTITLSNNDFEGGPGCVGTQFYGLVANSTLTVTAVYTCLGPSTGTAPNLLCTTGRKIGVGPAGLYRINPNVPGVSGGYGTIFADAAYDAAHSTTSCNVGAGPVACTGTGGEGTYGLNGTIVNTTGMRFVLGGAIQAIVFERGLSSGADYNLVVAYNTINGHATPNDTVCGGVGCSDGAFLIGQNSGTKTFVYNAIINSASRPLSQWYYGWRGPTSGLQTWSETYYANYVEGIGLLPYGNHGELSEDVLAANTTVALDQYSFNTFAQPNYPNSGTDNTSFIYASSGTSHANGDVWTATNIDHNILANNWSNTPTNTMISMSAIIELSYDTYTNTTFTSNFLDSLGVYAGSGTAQGCYAYVPAAGTVLTNPATWTGDTSLRTGNPTTGWGIGANVAGCK